MVKDRALWDRLGEEHGANDVQKVSEMFWNAKAKDNWMELRESLLRAGPSGGDDGRDSSEMW